MSDRAKSVFISFLIMEAMMSNPTEELCAKLDNLIYDLERLDIWLDDPASDMTLGEYEDKRKEIIELYAKSIEEMLGAGTCQNISDPPSGFLCSECGWGDFSEPTHLLKDAKHCPNCGKRIVEEKPHDND